MKMQNKQDIFFSIIVPAYNVEKYIKKTIFSIVNQNFKNYELIIVNDFSNDNTTCIINEISKQNPNIIVINHEINKMTHIARANGVTVANGKYIIFLDGDDYFVENAFNILYESIQKNPNNEVYEFGYIMIPSYKKMLPFFKSIDRFTSFFGKENIPAHTVWNKIYDSVLLKKSFALMKMENIKIIEDLYESIVISFFTKKIINIDEVIICYRESTGESTEYKDYSKTTEYLQLVSKTMNLIKLFLIENNLEINLDYLSSRLLEYTMEQYINHQKNKSDKKRLFLMLNSFFELHIIFEYFYQKEETLNNIINSRNYKLFIYLLKPLRKIKRIKDHIFFTRSK